MPEAIPAGRSLSGFLTAWPVLIAAAIGIVALVYRIVPPARAELVGGLAARPSSRRSRSSS